VRHAQRRPRAHCRARRIIQDDQFERLLTFPNVIITGHQAFFTQEALTNIAGTTVDNMARFALSVPIANVVRPPKAKL
jgi:D-lactate dehydrogenase